jgi:hypothetical protein
MYMYRIRHINDSVLSSLKMEGIRLLFLYEFHYDARIHEHKVYKRCYESLRKWRLFRSAALNDWFFATEVNYVYCAVGIHPFNTH